MHAASFVEALTFVWQQEQWRNVCSVLLAVSDWSHVIFVSVHPAIFGTARISLDL